MSSSQCIQNPPSLSSDCGAGIVEEFAGLNAYITGSQSSKLAILLVSDVFGYGAPNLRKLADKVAAAGFFVVVPDFFYGEPFDPHHANMDIKSWMKNHGADKGFEDARMVIAALKSKGVSAIGTAGFCWGGMVVTKLAKLDDLQAAVVLHPGPLTADEINQVKVPIAILGAEIDQHCPPEQIKHFGEILSSKPQLDSFVKIFPSVAHGWAVRYSIDDELAVKNAEEAHSDMLKWFVKYIK
ncbi:hypothetical protein LguiA_001495 [Lonicera macranthoides]